MTDILETPDSSATRLRVMGVFIGVSPADVFGAFTDADLITRWWPEVAAIDARVGGSLELGWPGMDLTLRGRYVDLAPHTGLRFTWKWDHEPDTPERVVTVGLGGEEGGTRIRLDHGDYGPGDEEERAGHLAGWQHFLPLIPGAVRG